MLAMKIPHTLRKGLIVLPVVVATIFAGCGLAMSNEDRLDRAEQAIIDGNYREAIIDAKDVLRKEPDNVRGRVLLGRASIRVNDSASAEKEFRRAIELGTDIRQIASDLGKAMLGLRQFDRVIDEITVDLAITDSDRLQILQLRGDALLGLKRPDEAREVFGEILVQDAGNVSAQLGIVSSYLAEQNYEQARATLDHILTTSEGETRPWLVSGQLYLEQRNAELAEIHFDKALSMALEAGDMSAEALALIGRGEAQLVLQKVEQARAGTERLSALLPDDPRAMLLAARLAYFDKDWERALGLLQDVLRRVPEYRPAQLLIGAVHLQNGNLEQAEMYLGAVLAAAPDNPDARNLLAETRLRQRDARAAQELLQPMVEGSAPNLNSLALAAQASFGAGDLEQTADYLQQRAEASGSDPDAQLDLVAMYINMGRVDEAQSILDRLGGDQGDASNLRRDMLSVVSLIRSEDLPAALASATELAGRWPENSRVLSMLGSVQALNGQADAARKSFVAASEFAPGEVLPLRLRSRFEEELGNFEIARELNVRIVDSAPDDPIALFALGRLAARSGDLQAARGWLERSVAADPGNEQIRDLFGRTLLGLQDFDAARDFAEKSIEQSGDSASAYNLLGHALLNLGDNGAAQTSFEKALALDPSGTESWTGLARAQVTAGNRDAAMATIAKGYAENPGDLSLGFALAAAKVGNQEYDAAMTIARDLARAHPDAVTPITLQAEILANTGKPAEAAALYDEALARENAPRFAARAYQLRSIAGLADKEAPLLEHLEEYPLNTDVRTFLAVGYQTDGRAQQAIDEYRKVLDADPRNTVALNNLAWLYHEAGNPEAEGIARKAYEIAPDDSSVADTLGWILVEKGATEEGLDLLESAAERSPERSEIQYHLAAALVKVGRSDEARGILEDVLQRSDNFSSRPKAEELLLQL